MEKQEKSQDVGERVKEKGNFGEKDGNQSLLKIMSASQVAAELFKCIYHFFDFEKAFFIIS